MTILVAHNSYQQRGGEDHAVDDDIALLRAHGHSVVEYRRHNDELAGMSAAAAARDTLWSPRTRREVAVLLQAHRPHIVHAHNIFPLISPSLYSAAAAARVPVVQTLHNFRLACPQAMFMRNGRHCEDCLGHVPWRSVVHGCYRGSRAQTLVVAGMLQTHRTLGTWRERVARYVVLNAFGRDKLLQAGLPAQRISLRGNFCAAPQQPMAGPRQGLCFVGRLGADKGVGLLAQAIAMMAPATSNGTLHVIGEGPDEAALKGQAGITLHGAQSPAAVMQAMQRAVAVVIPSIAQESMSRVLVEAYAAGTPVIASRAGALTELVHHGRTGFSVPAGDVQALAERLAWALQHPAEMALMGEQAKAEHARHYTPQRAYERLMEIYADARSA